MTADSTPKTADIIKSTKLALRDTDPILIAKAQLEISACQMHYLEAIDWKLWEIYSMIKKHSDVSAPGDSAKSADAPKPTKPSKG